MSSYTVTPGIPNDGIPDLVPPSDDLKVTWAPPVLVNPVEATFSFSAQQINVPPDRDVRLFLPSTPLLPTTALEIIGGRNVVLIGGEIAGDNIFPTDNGVQASLRITGTAAQRNPRVVHIEGVKMGSAFHSIDINAHNEPGLVVRLQNIDAVGNIIGIDSQGPPRVIQADRVHVHSHAIPVFTQPSNTSLAPPTTWTWRRCLFSAKDTNNVALEQNSVLPTNVIDNVYIDANPALLWPSQVLGMESAYWPGVVRTPAGFTGWLTGNPGVGYVQPGYLNPA